MSETKTLSERLRGVAEKFAVIHEERNRENTDVMVDEEVVFNACCRLDEAADALDAKDALLREAREIAASVIKSWDQRGGGDREQLKPAKDNIPAYWSPRASMVDSEAIAALRDLLLKLTEAQK